jgi:hypothetical protein
MCPVHDFYNETTGETVEVYVPISAEATQHQVQVVDGKKYKRVYTAPLAAVNSIKGAGTKEDFTRVTTNKKGLKVGDMWEISAEMSDRRASKMGGTDAVKEKFYDDFKKQNGVPHLEAQRQERLKRANERLKTMGVSVST